MGKILPTKTNLMNLQKTIRLSSQGKDLLEKKKVILQREREKYQKEYLMLETKVQELQNDAYLILKVANVDIGIERMIQIAKGIEVEDNIDIKQTTIMGVEIPSVVIKESNNNINYNFIGTTISVDEAIKKFRLLKNNLIQLAVLENTIHRLDENIQKVSTRSNALKEVILPTYQKQEKEIKDILEEREREQYSRQKMIKKPISN